MLVKRFQAPTASAALALVREALGPDAAVLETRRTENGIELLAVAERPRAGGAAASRDAASSAGQGLGEAAARLRDTVESAGFPRAIAERVASAAQANLGSARLADPDLSLACARELIALMVPTDTLLPSDAPTALAFVGAPGAGKTTTLAKLAARSSLLSDRPVIIATADTERLGGAEQAEAWARLAGAAFRVVTTGADVAAARDEAGPDGLLLVDTPGIATGDAGGLDRLGRLLAPLESWQIELTLAADRDPWALAETVRRFRPLRPGAIAATRLDETRRRGALLGLVARTGLPIRRVASGVVVPDDLADADAAGLAAWSLAAAFPGEARP